MLFGTEFENHSRRNGFNSMRRIFVIGSISNIWITDLRFVYYYPKEWNLLWIGNSEIGAWSFAMIQWFLSQNEPIHLSFKSFSRLSCLWVSDENDNNIYIFYTKIIALTMRCHCEMAFTFSSSLFLFKIHPMPVCPDTLFEAIKFYKYSLKHMLSDSKTTNIFSPPTFGEGTGFYIKCVKIKCLFIISHHAYIYHSVDFHPFVSLTSVLSVCSLQFFI